MDRQMSENFHHISLDSSRKKEAMIGLARNNHLDWQIKVGRVMLLEGGSHDVESK